MDTEITTIAREWDALRGCVEGLTDWTEEREAERMKAVAVKGIARKARKDPAAREQVESLLSAVALFMPEQARTFKAFYLDVDSRISARQLASRRYVSAKKVLEDNRKVFRAMCFPAMVCNGYMKAKAEQEA